MSGLHLLLILLSPIVALLFIAVALAATPFLVCYTILGGPCLQCDRSTYECECYDHLYH